MKRTELKRTAPMPRGTSTLKQRAPADERKPAPGRKPRKCAVKTCRKPFEPRSITHKACGPECAAIVAAATTAAQKAKAQRQERAADKVKREAMKPAKWWKAKAKKAMHLYVRTRDAGKPCASCDTVLLQLGRLGGDYDAGHLRSVGSAKHLEFDPRNVWGQCKYCNDSKGGNPQEYERRLRILKGDPFVDGLLADQAPRHYKAADYQAIEAEYKAKLDELKRTNSCAI